MWSKNVTHLNEVWGDEAWGDEAWGSLAVGGVGGALGLEVEVLG